MSNVLSVSDLNEYVRRSLAADPMLRGVQLRGEISNFKHYISSGHWYFSLKDDKCKVDCVMYRSNNQQTGFLPRDGMKVVLTGSAGLYPVSGAFQFYAESMKQDGIGDLYARFEALKRDLEREGLFDPARKRPLPRLPRMIGIVTSRTGAVIHDIARVAHRRNPQMQLVLYPSQVQGEGAAEEIVRGIRALSRVEGIDVIIIGRGGGSIEDLWAFNEEKVARAVAACPVPVISAVGHETDVTISDFAADVRAATPSAAAELAVTPVSELLDAVAEMKRGLAQSLKQQLLSLKNRLVSLEKRLQARHPLSVLRLTENRRALLEQRMNIAAQKRVLTLKSELNGLRARLTAISPANTLKRGYVAVLHDGRVVNSVENIPEELTLLFPDGRARAKVTGTERGDPFENGRNDL